MVLLPTVTESTVTSTPFCVSVLPTGCVSASTKASCSSVIGVPDRVSHSRENQSRSVPGMPTDAMALPARITKRIAAARIPLEIR